MIPGESMRWGQGIGKAQLPFWICPSIAVLSRPLPIALGLFSHSIAARRPVSLQSSDALISRASALAWFLFHSLWVLALGKCMTSPTISPSLPLWGQQNIHLILENCLLLLPVNCCCHHLEALLISFTDLLFLTNFLLFTITFWGNLLFILQLFPQVFL